MSRLRIKLDLKAFGRPRPEWSLVDVETLETVGDIAKNLASTRGDIIGDWNNIELHLDGCLLPEDEASNILQAGDVVEVVQKTKSLLKPANGKPKLNSSITNQSSREEGPPTKKPKVKEESSSSSSGSSSSEDENETPVKEAPKAKPVEKPSAPSKTTNNDESSSSDDSDSEDESPSKPLDTSEPPKKSLNTESKPKDPKDDTSKAENTEEKSTPGKKRKRRRGKRKNKNKNKLPPEEMASLETSESKFDESTANNQATEAEDPSKDARVCKFYLRGACKRVLDCKFRHVTPTYNVTAPSPSAHQQPTTSTKASSKKETAPIKDVQQHESNHKSSFPGLLRHDDSSVESRNVSAKASPRGNPETPSAPGLENLLKLAEGDVSQKLRQQSNTPGKSHKNGTSSPRSYIVEVEEAPVSVKKLQQYASSFQTVTCEEEILGSSEKKISKPPQPIRNGGTPLPKDRSGGIFGHGDSSVESRNVSAPSPDGSRTQENAGGLGNLLKLASSKNQKPLKGNRDKTSSGNKVDESLNGSNKSVLSEDAIKDLPSADWEKVEAGTTLAFKILEMSSNYQPQISDFKIGSVTEVDRATGELVVKLENSGEDTDEYDMTQGRFYVGNDEEEESGEDPNIMTLKWVDLILPRVKL